jgi:endoribonuclease Dicer
MNPNTTHVDNRPLYDIDPPEFAEGWHSFDGQPQNSYTSLYGSSVTLPRTLPLPERQFTIDRIYKTKLSAHRHAAFKAYRAL